MPSPADDRAYSEWQAEGEALARGDRPGWARIGDWLNRCPRSHGRNAAAASLFDLSAGTIANYAWLARHVAPAERLPGVTARLLTVVAPLPTDQQRVRLQEARVEGLNAAELRRRVLQGQSR